MVETTHTAGGEHSSLLRPFQNIGRRIADFFAPDSDAAATGDEYEINMELPGVALEDINIEFHDGMLTVRGEKKTEREEEGKTYFFSERTFGSFERSFRLPNNANADKIAASFKDGVLAIRVPKEGPPPEKTRRIQISGG